MSEKKQLDKSFAAGAEIETFRYRGPDRREGDANASTKPEVSREVRFNANGDPVLDVRTDVSRRRKDDDTVDLLKCLEDTALSIAED